MSSGAHEKAPLFVINRILSNGRIDDFVTWAWRAAMSSCCTDSSEFERIRHATDVRLVEVANNLTEEVSKTVEVPIADYEYICTSTAIGIIRDSADEALKDFKCKFVAAFQTEKSKK